MRRFVLAAVGAALVVAPAGIGTVGASAARGGPTAAHAAVVVWPVVRPGARGERVRVIQYLLIQRGYRLRVDGAYGKSTTAAVRLFQKARGLAVDGHVGPNTWQKLIVALKRGSRGSAVRGLQHQLRFQYGFRSVAVDGSFGAATQAAVKSFQRKRGLKVDGVVGAATWRVLES